MKSIKHGSKSFFFSTLFLPPQYWSRVNTLYELSRQADDIVDTAPSSEPTDQTNERLFTFYESGKVQNFFAQNNLPIKYFHELILGIETDLYKKSYKNFDELYVYCYRVGGTVGITMSYMFGVTDPKVLKYSEQLGVAMQLTNILRDIKEDALLGRIYIPQEDMQNFNVSTQDFVNGNLTKNVKDLISFYINKADYYFDEGNKGIAYLPKSTQFGIKVASDVYRQILRKIEENNFNVMEGRIYTTKKEKLKIALDAAF